MNGPLYWKGQLPVILLQLAAMVGLALLLLLGGMNGDSVALILLLWALVAALWLVRGYVLRKRQLEALLELARQLPEAYLLGEVMPAPTRADDQVFYHLLRQAGRSMLEQVSAVERERKEYKTYIQQWVHECKTPIAAGKLLCENHPSPLSQDLLPLWEAMDHYTEQALFYARSEHPEKDYLIRELPLFAPVHRAIAQNKYLLLQHQVRLEVEETEDTVFSDEKWLCFILGQLITNGVKYRHPQRPLVLTFSAARGPGAVTLSLRDNGIGIPPEDLPRIFDKGFTGQNGRQSAQNATGLGLYLCQRLCRKLDIGLAAQSSPEGTTMTLTFRVNDFIHQVQGD